MSKPLNALFALLLAATASAAGAPTVRVGRVGPLAASPVNGLGAGLRMDVSPAVNLVAPSLSGSLTSALPGALAVPLANAFGGWRESLAGMAVAGAVLPWMANLEFIGLTGGRFELGLFVQLANANPAASSLSRDLAVGATAVVIWMVQESRRLQMRGLAWVLLSCVTVAFACGAPLFLYLRERRLQELARA